MPCIENWAKDASPLIGGEARLFADFQPFIDSIYDSLLKPDENDATVQEISIIQHFQCCYKEW